MGPVSDGGLRGTIATKDIAAGEAVVTMPSNVTIDVADYRKPGAVSHQPCLEWPESGP